MKKKERDKFVEKFFEEFQKRQDLMEVSQCQNYNQKMNLAGSIQDDIQGTTVDDSDMFVQQKNAESMYSRQAFENLIGKIDLLEKRLEEQDDMIIDLKDSVKKQKNRIKQMEDCLNQGIKETNRKIISIMEIIRDMGIAGGMFDRYIKKKNVQKEVKKCANKVIKRNGKCKQLGMMENNGQWRGGNGR